MGVVAPLLRLVACRYRSCLHSSQLTHLSPTLSHLCPVYTAKPASPQIGDTSTAFASARPVPKASEIARKPLHAIQKPPPPPDDEEDFGFDLDLNPGQPSGVHPLSPFRADVSSLNLQICKKVLAWPRNLSVCSVKCTECQATLAKEEVLHARLPRPRP